MRILTTIVGFTVLVSIIVALYGINRRHPSVSYEQQLSSAQAISQELDNELNQPQIDTINPDNIAGSNLTAKYPVDYLFADSDRRMLTDEELAGKEIDFLKLARCEIYARRGYKFRSNELNRYFEDKIWYIVVGSSSRISDFTQLQFNETEKSNIEKLSRYEFELYKAVFSGQSRTIDQ